VRIYAVGLGTVDGAAAAVDGMPIYLRLDEPTLREVARMTDGEYHYAGTAEQLRSVYEKLGAQMQVQKRETEITGLLALASALLALAAGVLSLLWLRRIT
jgi:Ca-activated chloride channel homolog